MRLSSYAFAEMKDSSNWITWAHRIVCQPEIAYTERERESWNIGSVCWPLVNRCDKAQGSRTDIVNGIVQPKKGRIFPSTAHDFPLYLVAHQPEWHVHITTGTGSCGVRGWVSMRPTVWSSRLVVITTHRLQRSRYPMWSHHYVNLLITW